MFPSEVILAIDPRQLWIAGTAVACLATGWVVTMGVRRFDLSSPQLHRELILRLRTWAIIIPVTIVPIMLGAPGVAVAVFVLGFFCYREFARAIGLGKDGPMFACLVIGLLGVAIAIWKQEYRLLLLTAPLVTALTASVSLLRDQPHGYLKRVTFTNLGFVLCGLWPGHLGFLGSGQNNFTLLLWVILGICLNDVFAFLSGRLFGRTPLCRATSPGKTLEGFLGAIVLTTTLMVISGSFFFPDDSLGNVWFLMFLGVVISVSGSVGDLILSSIKRDLDLKDLSDSLPGHGGILDRCDSLIFAAPVVALVLGLGNAPWFFDLFHLPTP